jgi:hypothetical protein
MMTAKEATAATKETKDTELALRAKVERFIDARAATLVACVFPHIMDQVEEAVKEAIKAGVNNITILRSLEVSLVRKYHDKESAEFTEAMFRECLGTGATREGLDSCIRTSTEERVFNSVLEELKALGYLAENATSSGCKVLRVEWPKA